MHEANISSLQERKVLLTGAAGGVGRAVAAQMADAGAKVLLADRIESDLPQLVDQIKDSGLPEIHFVIADLSMRQGIAEVFEQVDEQLGGLDILVACAGVGSGPLMEMDDPGWRFVLETNLASYVACARFESIAVIDGRVIKVI